MKRWACMAVMLVAWAGLRAADSTNAPPSAAATPGAVLAATPGDSADEAHGLRRVRDLFAARPSSDGGDALKDWLISVVVRCEQFLADQPRSSHAAEVRAVDAQCRQELAALTGDHAEHDKAMQLARESLVRHARGPGAARARLVLAHAAWPEDLAAVLEQTRLIIRDYPEQPQAAGAFWLLARALQRKGDERGTREAAIGLFGAFPHSPEAAQARALLRQLSLVAQPAPLPALTTADGKALDLGAVRNQAILLDFWTAATLPAAEGNGLLRRLSEIHRDNLLVVGVNLDTDRAVFDKANAAQPTPWPQIFAGDPANAKLTEAYPALTPPTRVLVDPSGIVARIAAHPAEIELLMKRWQSAGMLAASATVAPAKPAPPVRPVARPAAKAAPVAVRKETPPPVKRTVVAAKQSPKPVEPPAPEKRPVAPPPPPPSAPAPQPTHIEIGGVLYAKPLQSAAAMPVESTKPAVKVEPSVAVALPRPAPPVARPFATAEKTAKLGRATTVVPGESSEPATVAAKPPAPATKSFASSDKPAKLSRVAAKPPTESAEPTTVAAKPPAPATKSFANTDKPAKLNRATASSPAEPTKPTAAAKAALPAVKSSASTEKPAKPRPASAAAAAKSKLKSDSAESLATMPDITESDRKAALVDAARRILKSEEELVTWAELESLFTTKKPASTEGSLVWYQDVADRCEQFIKEFPKSAHANLVRINEARCRLAVFQMTKNAAQRSRAETAAHEVLARKPNEDDAIRAEFLLLNATWPDHPEQGVAIAKRIVKDFPHRRETAAAILMHAQFRRRQTMLSAAKEAANDLLKRFPENDLAFNARSLIRQCDLLNNPCPPAKVTGLRGEKMDIAAMQGKPLLIEFWSAKSKNVLEDTAKLVQLYLRYHSKGFEIYTICVDKSREALDIFQLQHPLPWPVYWDGQGYQGALCDQFGVDTAPMRFMTEPGLQRVVSTHLSPDGVAAALYLWIDQNQPPLMPGQEPPVQGIFQKFFGLKF